MNKQFSKMEYIADYNLRTAPNSTMEWQQSVTTSSEPLQQEFPFHITLGGMFLGIFNKI